MSLFHELLLRTEGALMPWSGFLAGSCALPAVSAFRREAYLTSEILTYASGAGFLGLLAWATNPESSILAGALWLIGCLTGLAMVIWSYRSGAQWIDGLYARLTRRSRLARVGKTDVRTVADLLPVPKREYDPRSYYQGGNSESYFMGLDEWWRPIHWQGQLPHVAIAGTTGSGKGRKLQCLSVQSVAKGEFLCYLDPKDDEYGAHVVYAACHALGKAYHYLRLLPESPPQINLIAGAKAWEIEELLIAGMDLSDLGGPSDFYQAKNRKAARDAARIASQEGLTLAQLYRRFSQDSYWQEESPGFLDKLGELATVDAINAQTGAYSLADMMETGGAIYVVGSMTLNAVLRAQQMIFVRLQQLATARDRLAGTLKTVCVIADEMRFHITRPVIRGLATSRDKGMRVVLAFQSFGDLKDCPASMTPEMVEAAIIENCKAKLIYRVEDPDTADWLARKSGIIQTDDEAKLVTRNIALAETLDGERMIRQTDHYLIDSNMFSNLPAGCGVLFGLGLARTCHVSPVPVSKCREAITPDSEAPPASDDVPVSALGEPLVLRCRPDDDFFALE